MIVVHGTNPKKIINWIVGSSTAVVKGELLYDSSGAVAVAASSGTVATNILGVALENAAKSTKCSIESINGAIMEIDYKSGTTKTTFTDADLGTAYDVYVSSNNFYINLDDTTGGCLVLIGYDNDAKKAYVTIPTTSLKLAL